MIALDTVTSSSYLLSQFTNLCTLFIDNIDPRVSNNELTKLFSKYGKPEIRRPKKFADSHYSTAQVIYSNEIQAAEAKLHTQYHKLGKSEITVLFYHEKCSLTSAGKILVKNIRSEVQNGDLHELFSEVSPDLYVNIVKDNKKKNLRQGFVHFFNPEHATIALAKRNEWKLKEKTLEIEAWPIEKKTKDQSSSDLYIGNIPLFEKKEAIMKAYLEKFGAMDFLKMGINSQHEGYYAHVRFVNPESAENVHELLNYYSETLGEASKPLSVGWFEDIIEGHNRMDCIKINHLKPTVTEETIMKAFEAICPVKSIYLEVSCEVVNAKHAFITFHNESHAKRAFSQANDSKAFKDLFLKQTSQNIKYVIPH